MKEKVSKKQFNTITGTELSYKVRSKVFGLPTDYKRILNVLFKYLVSISVVLLHYWVNRAIGVTELSQNNILSSCAYLSLISAIYLIWLPKPNKEAFQKFLGKILQALAKALS